jgi:hypothetical protein
LARNRTRPVAVASSRSRIAVDRRSDLPPRNRRADSHREDFTP